MKETTKTFTLMQLFSIADGRLSNAGMDSVYDVLNWVFDDNFTTIALPMAMDNLNEINPQWLQGIREELQEIKEKIYSSNFEDIMFYIEDGHNGEYLIPQLEKANQF